MLPLSDLFSLKLLKNGWKGLISYKQEKGFYFLALKGLYVLKDWKIAFALKLTLHFI